MPAHWYGPKVLSFEIPAPGNPYDPEINDIEVRLTAANGHQTDRMAYWNGQKWECRFLVSQPGTYHASVYRNGKKVKSLPGVLSLTQPQKMPMITISSGGTRFADQTGRPFWPIGHDLGWHNPSDKYTIPQYLKVMSENGITWTRIWATFWDGRNPWWSAPIGSLDQKAYSKWDDIIQAGEQNHVYIQWTLFHHGLVSSTTDPNWPQNPWNAKNGGFLANAADFFTSPKALKLCKEYVRYTVARYSAYPDIFGWEIFNEVQWSDAAKSGHWDWIAKWHREMADYIRQIDPYHHPVTSSSNLPDSVNQQLDYINPHGYPASVWAMLIANPQTGTKPMFYAEVGPDSNTNDPSTDRAAARDGIWGGLIANDAGSGMFWYWDKAAEFNLYPEYKTASQIIHDSGILKHDDRSAEPLKIKCSQGSDLTFTPGQGWANGSDLSFELPQDVTNGRVGKIASYFQGKFHNSDMKTGPISFTFNAKEAGRFTVKVGTVAKAGSALTITLNGGQSWSKDWPQADKDENVSQEFSIPFSKGRNQVTIENSGNDWVTLDSFKVSGIGPAVSGAAVGDKRFMLARLFGKPGASFFLTGITLQNGQYKVSATDLNTGKKVQQTASVTDGKSTELKLIGDDEVIWISR